MRLKFNPPWSRCLGMLGTLILCLSTTAAAAASGASELPLILPEAVFASLGRVTGGITAQRIMDRGSIIRIQLAEPQNPLPPDTDVILFRQGLRLRDGKHTLGVLAVPVGQGRTLPRLTEDQEIADPNTTGVAWVRLHAVRQEVSRGDSLMTASEAASWADSACKDTDAPQGDTPSKWEAAPPRSHVIALAASNSQAGLLSSSWDLIAVSGGCAAGLTAGQSVSLWRPAVTSYGRKLDQAVEARENDSGSVFDDNPAITRSQTPGHRIGSGIVVVAYPAAALVRIRVATQPIEIGDQVRPTHIRKQP